MQFQLLKGHLFSVKNCNIQQNTKKKFVYMSSLNYTVDNNSFNVSILHVTNMSNEAETFKHVKNSR